MTSDYSNVYCGFQGDSLWLQLKINVDSGVCEIREAHIGVNLIFYPNNPLYSPYALADNVSLHITTNHCGKTPPHTHIQLY